jgi:AraC-like DNA-binding protein
LYIPQNVAYAANYSDTEMFVIHFHTAENDLEPEVFSAPNPEQIYRTFLAAHTLWQNKNAGYQAFILSRLYDIFGQICEQKTAETLPAYFLNAVSYINDNFKSSTLSIPDICERTGIGATYLRTLFKKHYNQRPTEYIIGLRLDHARNLIACGVPVKEAAFESGFRDSKYFARVVKQHFHCTPRELELYGK